MASRKMLLIPAILGLILLLFSHVVEIIDYVFDLGSGVLLASAFVLVVSVILILKFARRD